MEAAGGVENRAGRNLDVSHLEGARQAIRTHLLEPIMVRETAKAKSSN
jgi:hypothetical protein